MSFFEAIILGLVQGLTEFVPVSSSGHLILVRDFFNFSSANGLAFDAVLQLATVLAVVVYFLRDIPTILKDRKFLLVLVLGTIPAIIFGFLLESKMETVFRSSQLVALMLIVGAGIMYFADRVSRLGLNSINPKNGFLIGLFQSLALIPGISRSGATISGGLFVGLTRETAARFSFLLSVPIIGGSGLKKLLELSGSGVLMEFGLPLLLGSIVAFISGLWAVSFLIRYLKTHSLKPFIWYRIILASLILILL